MILNLEIKDNGILRKKLELNTDKLNIKKIEEEKFNWNRTKIFTSIIYEVEVTEKMREFCWDFSERIILGENQFNRLNPSWTNDKEKQRLIRTQRTYVGKIGELCFLILLASKNIKIKYDDMFEIFKGQANTDSYDFKTKDGKSIDIKTAFRPFHKNLVVNLEQLDRIPKYFYVGIKLDAKDSDGDNKIIDLDSIKKAMIYGYAECNYIKKLKTTNLSEGFCKRISLERLMNIDGLIKLIE